MINKLFILFLCISSLTFASWNPPKYICAASYVGNEWAGNFWSSEFDTIDADLEQIKAEGFNTIVLVVPWNSFQLSQAPIQYDHEKIKRLVQVIRSCKAHGLFVVLRVSYAWGLSDTVQRPALSKIGDLFINTKVYDAWLDYISVIYQSIRHEDNVLLTTLAWEDFWLFGSLQGYSAADRIMYAQLSGYQQYLQGRFSLEYLSALYNTVFHSYRDIPLPTESMPAIVLVYQYWDYFLINRLLVPAQRVMPGVSLEVRCDDDKVPSQPNEKEKPYYQHKAMYDVKDTPYLVSYYLLASGQVNQGEKITAKQGLAGLEWMLQRMQSANIGKRKLFLDQFIFDDNTTGFDKNAKLYPKEKVLFIKGVAPLLKKYTMGYALWTYKEHVFNVIYNPSFALGLKGWTVTPTAAERCDVVSRNGKQCVAIKQGMEITQYLSNETESYFLFTGKKPAFLSFDVYGVTANTVLEVRTENKRQRITLKKHVQKYKIELRSRSDTRNLGKISLRLISGEACLDNIRVYAFIQQRGLYDIQNKHTDIYDSILELNKQLTRSSH